MYYRLRHFTVGLCFLKEWLDIRYPIQARGPAPYPILNEDVDARGYIYSKEVVYQTVGPDSKMFT